VNEPNSLAPPSFIKTKRKSAFKKVLDHNKLIQFLAGQNVACMYLSQILGYSYIYLLYYFISFLESISKIKIENILLEKK